MRSAVKSAKKAVWRSVERAAGVRVPGHGCIWAVGRVATVQDLTGQTCGTELCCPDCEAISVTRIIDGDTFDSNVGRIKPLGYDAPEVGER